MFERWFAPPDTSYLLLGPRRAGKTTILKSLYRDFTYATLDDFDFLSWARRDPKGFVASLAPRGIIDEVQRVPEVTVAVKHLLDERRLRVVMTGSSSIGLLDAAADTLAGRIAIRHFPTACWGEEEGPPTHEIFGGRLDPKSLADASRRLEEALVYGGFPEVVTRATPGEKLETLKMYRDTFFTRDLAQLSNIENIEGLLAILHHIGRSIGSHLEVSNFARESGLSHPTAKRYLNILGQSGLGFKLYGHHFGPAKRYLKAAKLYFADNGIFKALGSEVSRGQLLENFVISELEKRRKLGFIKTDQFYYFKSSSGAEIDLIIEEEEVLRIVEVKATEQVHPRDLRNLREYAGHAKGTAGPGKPVRAHLFYLGKEYLEEDGIHCIPIAALWRGR